MGFINYSDLVRNIIQSSGRLAVQFKYDAIEPEHLLLALIDECLRSADKNGIVFRVFKHFNINLFELIEDIENTFDSTTETIIEEKIAFSTKAEYIVKVTYLEAKRYDSIEIEAEHLLLSYLRAETAFSNKIMSRKYNLAYGPVKDYIGSIFKEN